MTLARQRVLSSSEVRASDLEHGGSWVRIPSVAQIFSVSSYGLILYISLYLPTFTLYTENNRLTYVLSSAKLNSTGHRWVAELAV